jgi:Leucine-rich repeat (LRR) protein
MSEQPAWSQQMKPVIQLAVVLATLVSTSQSCEPSAAAIDASELQALKDLYSATHGSSWVEQEGWLSLNDPTSPTDPCDWHGITCNDDGTHVTAIRLARNELSGHIPPSIGRFQHLTILDMSRNTLVGRLPASLFHLASLQDVDLSYNQLTGDIPRMRHGHLTRLSLSDNRLRGHLEALSSLTNLRMLDLSNNAISGTIGALRLLTSLRTVDLSNNRLNGSLPAAIAAVPSLREVDLSFNTLSGPLPSEWGDLVDMRVLNLSANSLSGAIPDSWRNLNDLLLLDLSNNQLVGTVQGFLFEMDSLRDLNLSANMLTGPLPDPVPFNHTLNVFRADRNQLDGPLPRNVNDLTALGILSLSENRLTGSIPDIALDALAVLDLSGNGFGGHLPRFVATARLWSLNLSRNRLEGPLPAELGTLSNLKQLDLSRNRLSGQLSPGMQRFDRLQVVDLSHNYLEGPVAADLFRLNELISVDISFNRFDGPLPLSVDSAVLQELRLNDNLLTGELPSWLKEQENLIALSVRNNQFTSGLSILTTVPRLRYVEIEGNLWHDVNPSELIGLPPLPEVIPLVEAGLFESLQRPTPQPPAPSVVITQRSEPKLGGRAQLLGRVVDDSGQPIPGASIVISQSSAVAVAQQTVSSSDGRFAMMLPRAGEYVMTATLAGFNVIKESLNLASSSVSSVDVTFAAGGIAETVTVAAENDPGVGPGPWWNVWPVDPSTDDTIDYPLQLKRRYGLVLELSGLRLRRLGLKSHSVSPELATRLKTSKQGGVERVTITVSVFGRAVQLADVDQSIEVWQRERWIASGQKTASATLEIDLDVLRSAAGNPFVMQATTARAAALRVHLQTLERGCGIVVFSVWNEDRSAPLDSVVVPVATGDAKQCDDVVPTTGRPVLVPAPSSADAAIHVTEYEIRGSRKATVVMTLRSSPVQCDWFIWSLGDAATPLFLDNPEFQDLLNATRDSDAATGRAYHVVGKRVREGFFPKDDTPCGATKALSSLRSLAESRAIRLYARITNPYGVPTIFPLGLISMELSQGRRLFKHAIMVSSPLAQQTATATTCVDKWTLVLPPKLNGVVPEFSLPSSVVTNPDLIKVLRTADEFEEYAEDSGSESEGMVLFAHHSSGWLTFQTPVERFPATSFVRRLGPGGIALVSACRAATVTSSAILLTKLNRLGVDAIIASPFDVPADFGSTLAQHFTDVIVERRGASRFLSDVLVEALERTRTELSAFGARIDGNVSEIVLAGNPSIKVCLPAKAFR